MHNTGAGTETFNVGVDDGGGAMNFIGTQNMAMNPATNHPNYGGVYNRFTGNTCLVHTFINPPGDPRAGDTLYYIQTKAAAGPPDNNAIRIIMTVSNV